MKSLVITFGDKKYKAEFTREAVKNFEGMGFTTDDLRNKYATAIVPFFYCALKSNHPTISMKKAQEIYDSLNNRVEFISKLMEMYAETYQSLTDENESGNATWEANWSDEQ